MEAITNSYLLQYQRHPHGLTLTRINKIIEPHIVRHLNQTKYCTSALTRYKFPPPFSGRDARKGKDRVASLYLEHRHRVNVDGNNDTIRFS